jgi:hypothetical protein
MPAGGILLLIRILVCGRKMITSLFSTSGLAGLRPAKPDVEKRETGFDRILTQGGGRSAPLPWAIIRLPLRGAGTSGRKANYSMQRMDPAVQLSCMAGEGQAGRLPYEGAGVFSG